jgi:hypothetical protein
MWGKANNLRIIFPSTLVSQVGHVLREFSKKNLQRIFHISKRATCMANHILLQYSYFIILVLFIECTNYEAHYYVLS